MSPLRSLFAKDCQAFRNLFRLLRHESPIKVIFITTFMLGLLAGLFAFFLRGFVFLSSLSGVGFMITQPLFSLFFLGLGIMLVLSSIVSMYSTAFRSAEVTYLLAGPFSYRDIVTYSFARACSLSSWAFFFIMAPFMAAYAWHEKLTVLFSLWTLLFSLPFLVICCGLGSILALLLVRFLPNQRSRLLVVLLSVVTLIAVFTRHHANVHSAEETSFFLFKMVPGLKAASWPLSPSWWTAEGIMALTRGQFLRGFLLWSVLLANTLLVLVLVQEVGAATFFSALQRMTEAGSDIRRRAVLLPWLDHSLKFLHRDVRCIVMKDIRLFLRDPLQWSQALIFFGLLGLYFASLRSFHYDALPDIWRNFITFLNLFSVAAVLCSISSRFVYPQLSLEGHSFWILGLSPMTCGRILMTKFALALVAIWTVSIGLVLLSTHMLQMALLVRLMTVSIIAAVGLAVCALSTGLGAVFLDLKQPNPVAIVSGVGGTINLILSLLFLMGAILPFALLFHLYRLERIATPQLHRGLAWATAWLILITLLATILPLYAGYRSLRERDY